MPRALKSYFLVHALVYMIAFVFFVNANAEEFQPNLLEEDVIYIPAGSFLFGTDKKDMSGEALSLGLPKPWYIDEGPEQDIRTCLLLVFGGYVIAPVLAPSQNRFHQQWPCTQESIGQIAQFITVKRAVQFQEPSHEDQRLCLATLHYSIPAPKEMESFRRHPFLNLDVEHEWQQFIGHQ